jgi:hypothetical protein
MSIRKTAYFRCWMLNGYYMVLCEISFKNLVSQLFYRPQKEIHQMILIEYLQPIKHYARVLYRHEQGVSLPSKRLQHSGDWLITGRKREEQKAGFQSASAQRRLCLGMTWGRLQDPAPRWEYRCHSQSISLLENKYLKSRGGYKLVLWTATVNSLFFIVEGRIFDCHIVTQSISRTQHVPFEIGTAQGAGRGQKGRT